MEFYGQYSFKFICILFTVILNELEAFKAIIQDLHQGKSPYTPIWFKKNKI